MRNYPTNKIVYNRIDGIWSKELADKIDYKISNNRGYRYIFIINDNFSNYTRAILLKNKNSQTITQAFLSILTISKRSPLELKSDRGKD